MAEISLTRAELRFTFSDGCEFSIEADQVEGQFYGVRLEVGLNPIIRCGHGITGELDRMEKVT